MTQYQFLLAQKESGELYRWFQYGVNTYYLKWLEIYAYHLAHPKVSMSQMEAKFGYVKAHISNIYSFMNEGHRERQHFSFTN